MDTATEPIITILGERVALGPLVREQVPLFARWLNDFAVARTFDTPVPRPIEAVSAMYEGQARAGDAYPFTVYERASWRPIGRTILYDVDWRGRTADFSIVIGEADARGQGYGTETTRLMLDYAFTALGLHSVMLTTRAFNLAGLAAYRKAGFKEFGRRRQCSFLSGRLYDKVYMDCLASEFASPVLSTIFVPDEPRKERTTSAAGHPDPSQGGCAMRVKRGKPADYELFATRPMPIRPFDPDSKRAALAYGAQLNELLAPLGVAAELHGSLALELAGKGEWEFSLFPSPDQWYPTLTLLVNHFRSVFSMAEEVVMFNDVCDGHNVEVIVFRGDTAACNRAIMQYWRDHPEARTDYEAQKYLHCHSKRDYYRWKDNYIADILETL